MFFNQWDCRFLFALNLCIACGSPLKARDRKIGLVKVVPGTKVKLVPMEGQGSAKELLVSGPMVTSLQSRP